MESWQASSDNNRSNSSSKSNCSLDIFLGALFSHLFWTDDQALQNVWVTTRRHEVTHFFIFIRRIAWTVNLEYYITLISKNIYVVHWNSRWEEKFILSETRKQLLGDLYVLWEGSTSEEHYNYSFLSTQRLFKGY